MLMYLISTRSSEGDKEHISTGDLPGTLLESRGIMSGSCSPRGSRIRPPSTPEMVVATTVRKINGCIAAWMDKLLLRRVGGGQAVYQSDGWRPVTSSTCHITSDMHVLTIKHQGKRYRHYLSVLP